MSDPIATLPDNTAEKIARTRSYEAAQSAEAAMISAKLANALLDEIVGALKPGMRESEAKTHAQAVFDANGIEKLWHTTYVRFGSHTLLTFMDRAKEDLVLQEEDIAFVDLGIVKGGVEGDAGKTVVFGSNPCFSHLRDASQAIFHESREFWRKQNPDGITLYEHIHDLAAKMNVEFNLDPAGHLIGAHPHLGWRRGINTFPEHVQAAKWILEIQIKDKAQPFGAFFEDLLY